MLSRVGVVWRGVGQGFVAMVATHVCWKCMQWSGGGAGGGGGMFVKRKITERWNSLQHISAALLDGEVRAAAAIVAAPSLATVALP